MYSRIRLPPDCSRQGPDYDRCLLVAAGEREEFCKSEWTATVSLPAQKTGVFSAFVRNKHEISARPAGTAMKLGEEGLLQPGGRGDFRKNQLTRYLAECETYFAKC